MYTIIFIIIKKHFEVLNSKKILSGSIDRLVGSTLLHKGFDILFSANKDQLLESQHSKAVGANPIIVKP